MKVAWTEVGVVKLKDNITFGCDGMVANKA
jgi:hypothetical protein